MRPKNQVALLRLLDQHIEHGIYKCAVHYDFLIHNRAQEIVNKMGYLYTDLRKYAIVRK